MNEGRVQAAGVRGAKVRAGLAGLLLVVLALQLVHVARVYSANWDEAHHLYDGYRIWTERDYRLNAEVPPLVKLLAALPLLPMHIVVPSEGAKVQGDHAFRDGRAFVFGNGGDRVLFPARMACMVLTLLLAGLLYVAAGELFGGWAGLLALALFVFDPLVLAHGTLVSTDVGSALFLFATVYAFYRYAKAPGWGRLLLVGLALGLAMSTKFTGVFGVPMLLLLAGADGWMQRSWAVFWRRVGACGVALACAVVVVWAFYGFRYAAAPAGLALSPALGPYLAAMPGKANGVVLGWIARAHLLPEAYVWGLAFTKYTEQEYTSYFFGRMYAHGPAWYFPVGFLIKSTLPLLLGLVLLPFVWFRQGDRHRRALWFVMLPVLFYFAVVSSSHMDIGVRHLMPVYPFLYALAGVAVAQAWTRRGVWAVAAVALLGWQVVTSVRVAPDYMAYGNEAWGGPAQVHRYLSDANTDWGQQLKAVKLYLDENHITNCWFAYFPDGAVEPEDYGVHCRRLPTGSSLWWFKLPMEVPPVIDGTVLISDSDLEGVESGDGPLNWFAPFGKAKPVAIIQHGVYVYQGQFAVPLMSAVTTIRNAEILAKAGRDQEALQQMQSAAALAPDSAMVEIDLADQLAKMGRWQEAVGPFRRAGELARTVRPELEPATLVPRSVMGLQRAREHGAF